MNDMIKMISKLSDSELELYHAVHKKSNCREIRQMVSYAAGEMVRRRHAVKAAPVAVEAKVEVKKPSKPRKSRKRKVKVKEIIPPPVFPIRPAVAGA